MADELDIDALVARFRARAAAVKQRNLPPVAGEERRCKFYGDFGSVAAQGSDVPECWMPFRQAVEQVQQLGYVVTEALAEQLPVVHAREGFLLQRKQACRCHIGGKHGAVRGQGQERVRAGVHDDAKIL